MCKPFCKTKFRFRAFAINDFFCTVESTLCRTRRGAGRKNVRFVVPELKEIIMSCFSLFLANEFSIAFASESNSFIMQKDKHIQLLLNCIYALVLCSRAEEPRVIPEGEVFLVFKNRNPTHREEPVESCEEHRKAGNGKTVFDLMGTTQASLFKFQNVHWGLRWRIPEGNTQTSLSLPIKFICGSSDADWASTYCRWDFEAFYTGALANFTVLPLSPCFKVVKKLISPRRVKEEEPLTVTKQEKSSAETVDWDFGSSTEDSGVQQALAPSVSEQRKENLLAMGDQLERVLENMKVTLELENASS